MKTKANQIQEENVTEEEEVEKDDKNEDYSVIGNQTTRRTGSSLILEPK